MMMLIRGLRFWGIKRKAKHIAWLVDQEPLTMSESERVLPGKRLTRNLQVHIEWRAEDSTHGVRLIVANDRKMPFGVQMVRFGSDGLAHMDTNWPEEWFQRERFVEVGVAAHIADHLAVERSVV